MAALENPFYMNVSSFNPRHSHHTSNPQRCTSPAAARPIVLGNLQNLALFGVNAAVANGFHPLLTNMAHFPLPAVLAASPTSPSTPLMGVGMPIPPPAAYSTIQPSTAYGPVLGEEQHLRMQGAVKSFYVEKGYGWISCPQVGRDVFVHANDLSRPSDKAQLPFANGTILEFDLAQRPRGLSATNVVVVRTPAKSEQQHTENEIANQNENPKPENPTPSPKASKLTESTTPATAGCPPSVPHNVSEAASTETKDANQNQTQNAQQGQDATHNITHIEDKSNQRSSNLPAFPNITLNTQTAGPTSGVAGYVTMTPVVVVPVPMPILSDFGAGMMDSMPVTPFGQRYRGNVVYYAPSKGFGFLQAQPGQAVDQATDKIYVHIYALEKYGVTELDVGMALEFNVRKNHKGKYACNVNPCSLEAEIAVPEEVPPTEQVLDHPQSVMMLDGRKRGTVKSYDPKRLLGWVQCDGQDVFLNIYELRQENAETRMHPGTELEFNIGQHGRGPTAYNIDIVDPASVGHALPSTAPQTQPQDNNSINAPVAACPPQPQQPMAPTSPALAPVSLVPTPITMPSHLPHQAPATQPITTGPFGITMPPTAALGVGASGVPSFLPNALPTSPITPHCWNTANDWGIWMQSAYGMQQGLGQFEGGGTVRAWGTQFWTHPAQSFATAVAPTTAAPGNNGTRPAQAPPTTKNFSNSSSFPPTIHRSTAVTSPTPPCVAMPTTSAPRFAPPFGGTAPMVLVGGEGSK